jgi:uncharacterized protein
MTYVSKKPPKLTVNEAVHVLHKMLVNSVLSRTSSHAGIPGVGPSLDGNSPRQLDRECRYIEGDPSLQQYRMMYDQEGFATRIVSVFAEECWSIYPELYETEDNRRTKVERAWDEFEYEHDPWGTLAIADEISGIGHFGIVLIGANDGGKLNTRHPGIDENGQKTGKIGAKEGKILFLQPYSEDLVRIASFNNDSRSPRFGLPEHYQIHMGVPPEDEDQQSVLPQQDIVDVHWSRVLHVSEGTKTCRWASAPRLRNLHRRVFDVRKILGGAGEMLYRGGFPGISFETLPELTDVADIDMDSVKAEIEAYAEGMQRYIRLIGMTAKSLSPQVADPTNHLMANYVYACATMGIPVPVFLGQQAGQLASLFNGQQWNRKLAGRQTKYLTPKMARPLVERLVAFGAMPEPLNGRVIIKWRDLNALSDTDKAKVALQKAQAILQYVTSGAVKTIRPKQFFTFILQMSDEEADAVIGACGGEDAIVSALDDMMKADAGNSNAKDPAKKTGSLGKKNALG